MLLPASKIKKIEQEANAALKRKRNIIEIVNFMWWESEKRIKKNYIKDKYGIKWDILRDKGYFLKFLIELTEK